MKSYSFARKRRQLKFIAKQIRQVLVQSNGQLTTKVERLSTRLTKMLQHFPALISSKQLRKTLGATAVFLGLGMTNIASAQIFAPPVTNPFLLDPIPYFVPAAYADLDNDGDVDMLVESYEYIGGVETSRYLYFKNEGTTGSPSYAPLEINPFGLSGVNSYVVTPRFVDIDGDGDQDLMGGRDDGDFIYYENTGTANNPNFASPQINPFNLKEVAYNATPMFADFDNDGDLDMMAGESGDDAGNFMYFENMGTATAPNFSAVVKNPFGIKPLEDYNLPTLGDVDLDGDVDLLASDEYGTLFYYENTGSSAAPIFANPVSNPLGIGAAPLSDISFPVLTDIDLDGDLDLMVSEATAGNFKFYENTLKNPVGLQELSPAFGLDLFPNPVDNILQLRFETELEEVVIMDVLGRTTLKITEQDKRNIALGNLNPGTYWLRATNKEGAVVFQKIQKL